MIERDFKKGRLKQALSIVFVALVLFLMGRILVRNWKAIPFSELRFNSGWFFSSLVCLFASFALSAWIWVRLLKGLKIKISFVKAMKSIALSQVGRYAPGRIWSYVGRAELGKQEAIPRSSSALGLFVETELLVVSSSLVFLLTFAMSFSQWWINLPKNLYWVLMLIPVEFILLHPKITNALSVPVFNLFHRDAPKVTLRYITLLELVLLYVVAWSFSGFGFYLLAKTVYPLSWNNCVAVSGAYPAAWLIGFLSIVTPSGFGVREGVLVVLLSPLFPTPMAVTLSLLARVWTTLFELIVFLLFIRA